MGLGIDVNQIKHFREADFDRDVLEARTPVLVDFYADWCGPCLMVAPVVEQLANDYSGSLTVGKLDVDESQEIAFRYGVMSIPTLAIFRDGRLADRLVGFPGAAAVQSWVERALQQPAAA